MLETRCSAWTYFVLLVSCLRRIRALQLLLVGLLCFLALRLWVPQRFRGLTGLLWLGAVAGPAGPQGRKPKNLKP